MSQEQRMRHLEEGTERLRQGAFFDAHESFEDLWKSASTHREREVWQGLSQVSASLVKHDRGESATAISLMAKARSRIAGAGLPALAMAELKGWLDALTGAVMSEKVLPSTALPPGTLRLLREMIAEPGGDAGGGAPS